MKVFITGGTGFIGTYLVKRLLETEHQLLCLARKTSDTRFLKKAGVDILIGDVTDKSSLLKGMEGRDCVLHLASSFVLWSLDNRIFHDVNVTGTRYIMESVLDKGVSKVVYVSSAAIWGNAKGVVTEETPVGNKRPSKYIRTKYEGDLIAWELYEKKKLPLVMIYPSGVIGVHQAIGRYIKNYAMGRMPAQIFTRYSFPFVYVKDVAEAIVRAMEKKDNIGEKYIISAENYTFGEFNQMVSDISGTKLPFLKLPKWMAMMNAYFFTGIANLIKKPPVWDMSVDQMSISKLNIKLDGSKAEKELGLKYTPIYDGLKETIESFK
jgi:dihydroflavonol-4-reductase